MAEREYAIEEGEPKRIKIFWKGAYKNLSVHFDGKEIAPISNETDIEKGYEFLLPDGSIIKAKLIHSFMGRFDEFQVLRNDKPLPGSESHPIRKLRYAYGIICFFGAAHVVFGLICVLFNIQLLSFEHYSIPIGLMLLILGYLTKRKSKIALGIAVTFISAEIILGLIGVIQATKYETRVIVRILMCAGIFICINFLPFLFRGFGAISDLKPKNQQKLKRKFEERINKLRQHFEGKDSEELLKILQEENTEEWSDEAIEAIKRIIAERGKAQP